MIYIPTKKAYFSSITGVIVILLALVIIPRGVYAKTTHTSRLNLSVAGQTLIAENNDGNQNKNILISDYLSSTKSIVDESGSVSTYPSYYPYGSSTTTLNLDPTNKYYTGQRKVTDDSDLYNYNARYYNPNTGIFIQPDSVEGPNRYAYVGGNPIMKNDPSGNAKLEQVDSKNDNNNDL